MKIAFIGVGEVVIIRIVTCIFLLFCTTILVQCTNSGNTRSVQSSGYLTVEMCVARPAGLKDVTIDVHGFDPDEDDLEIAFRIYELPNVENILFISLEIEGCLLKLSSSDASDLVRIDKTLETILISSYLSEVQERIESLFYECHQNNYPESSLFRNARPSAYSEPVLFCDYYASRNTLVLGFEGEDEGDISGLQIVRGEVYFWERKVIYQL